MKTALLYEHLNFLPISHYIFQTDKMYTQQQDCLRAYLCLSDRLYKLTLSVFSLFLDLGCWRAECYTREHGLRSS